ARTDHRLSSSRRPRCSGGYPRVCGLYGSPVLRFAACQGHRSRVRSERSPQPDGAGPRQLHPRGGDDDHPLSLQGHPSPRFRRGEGGHEVSRATAATLPPGRMTLDVVFTPAGLTAADIQGRTVFVIDILRATTVMCAALAHGAKTLIPAASTEEALRL